MSIYHIDNLYLNIKQKRTIMQTFFSLLRKKTFKTQTEAIFFLRIKTASHVKLCTKKQKQGKYDYLNK